MRIGNLSDTVAFIIQEIISSNSFNPCDFKCPRCQQKTMILKGKSELPQREFMENGVVTESQIGDYLEGSFNIETIDCLTCNVQFIIKDHELYELELENAALKKKLEAKKGLKIDTNIN
jgi:hypothetical protein